jgi:hypothetical protein
MDRYKFSLFTTGILCEYSILDVVVSALEGYAGFSHYCWIVGTSIVLLLFWLLCVDLV